MKKISANLKAAHDKAFELASVTGGFVGSEHLLYGLLMTQGSIASELLINYGLSVDHFAKYLERRPTNAKPVLSTRSAELLAAMEQFNVPVLGTEHLLYVILANRNRCVANEILQAANIDVRNLLEKVTAIIRGDAGYDAKSPVAPTQPAQPTQPPSSMLDNLDSVMDFARRALGELGVDVDNANFFTVTTGDSPKNSAPNQQFFSAQIPLGKSSRQRREDYEEANDGGQQKKKEGSLGELDNFGVNLTERAKNGKLDPVIGRGREIERVIQILCRRTKNNPVLIGEPGIGKSAVVDGLAQSIADGKVPDGLKDKIIFSLDITSIVAGTKYRGDFEERLQNAVKAIQSNGNIIVFIDEIHMIVRAGSGGEGSLDIANILKPMLARGELQTIGATTIDEYHKYIEKDAALERRFQPIAVEEPTVSETIEILMGLKKKYEEYHKVEISDEAISAAAILSDRYITDRFLPDKAIDLIDEAASRKKIFTFTTPQEVRDLEAKIADIELKKNTAARQEQYDLAKKYLDDQSVLKEQIERAKVEWAQKCKDIKLAIGEEEIAEIVGAWTGIPVLKITESESKKLIGLEDTLHKRVVGQSEAVSAVARAIRRARAGLKDPNRPIGSFIFLGPTGVGKTELSKALAEAMFGDENSIIRVDMSEYMEKINVSKLIGSAPGYVGYEEGGQLTEKVRRKPYSVVLFDEIEKAHPDIFNILLQILEDGRLTDSLGRTVSFKNTIVIMTSNVGASEIAGMKKLGFGLSASEDESEYEQMKEKQMEALKNIMKPELINRIDDIIIFKKLNKEDMRQIGDIMLAKVDKMLKERNINVELTTAAKNFLLEKGFDEKYGARPLRRAIQKMVEDRLSEGILKGDFSIGDSITIDAGDDGLVFTRKKV